MTTQRSIHTLLSLSLGLVALVGCDMEPSDIELDDPRELDEHSDGEDLDADPIDAPRPDELTAHPDLYDTVSAPINLAFGKPTTQSTTFAGGVSSRAVDGNLDGNGLNGTVSHTNLDTAGWWQVDLQSVEPIGEIVIHNRTDNDCGPKLHDFDVKVSADGVTWETFQEAGIAGAKARVLIDRVARYVRIENPTTLHMAEVEVFRTRNLAFGRPTTQSTTVVGGEPSRAVDGNTDGNAFHGSVSHTAVDGPGQWWQVDLESVQNVGQVVIFNRTDNDCGPKLHDFTVSVSNDGVNWEGHLFEGAAGEHVLAPINRDARYVRIENSDRYLHLAEVQVFEQARLPGISYGRGVGTIPSYGCEPGDLYDVGLCYTPCAAGYTNVLNLCYEDCAPGYADLGLICTNANLQSYNKDIYDRGVGTFPVPTCAVGEQLDAGLCYPVCDPGYVGVGPMCWLGNLTVADIPAVGCDLLRIPLLSMLAEAEGTALTSGAGLSIAVGATGTTEIGVAYGAEGEFGCYVSACGGFTTNVALGAYVTMGAYDEFSSITGQSSVASAGVSVGIPDTPISFGGGLGMVTAPDGTPIGSTLSASVSVGADALTPVDLGDLDCQTGVLQTQAW